MSSDSEDDYSYTNSVSVLKALTRKKDKNIDSDTTTGKQAVNFFESPKSEPVLLRSERIEKIKSTAEIIQIDNSPVDEIPKETKSDVLNDSCVVLSDGEADLTPVNIISQIDDVLQKSISKRKPRRKRKLTPPTTRKTRQQSKRGRKANNNSSNSTSTSDITDICIVDEDPIDINEVNYELTIKVYWKSQYLEKFTMRRFDKITTIFKHFSEKEDVPENRLLFTIKDRIISKNDTPASLNITAATIIEGGILSAKSDVSEGSKQQTGIEFKVQMKDRKHPLLINMRPDDKMEVLMCQCAQELDISVKKLKFYCDGELIKSGDTPESLDLESGEIIDCVK